MTHIPKKGWLQSLAIRNILYMILTPVVTELLSHSQELQDKLLSISPDWLDPAIAPIVKGASLALMALFGVRASIGVKQEASGAPTNIKGLVVKKTE